MVVLKLIERSIGLVSTVILARLLIPADFGLVAMAMAVFAMLEILGQFGFSQDLIRQKNPSVERFNTAWTLTVCHGVFSAVALALLAAPLAGFFKEPRLESVIHVLAVVAFIQSFENIGLVLFRKELDFRKDFNFLLAKKLIAFVCTVTLALTFRSYWALVGGIVVSRTAGVVLSYIVHPFRPRLCFSETASMFRYSRWILLNGLLDYCRTRSIDFVLGRFSGAASLGLFRISSEISSLPTSQLMFPIMRATYPGYAKFAHDRKALKQAFLKVQGTVVMLTLPAGIGIVLLADPIVRVFLGPNWLDAVPIMQVLGLHGAARVFRLTNNSIFNVLGVPRWNTVFIVLELIAVVPLFTWLVSSGRSLEVAVWAYFCSSLTVVPIAVVVMSRFLGLGFHERVAAVWRPVVGTLVMAAAVWLSMTGIGAPASAAEGALALALLVPLGVFVYVSCVLGLWWLAGRPAGPERSLIDLLGFQMAAILQRLRRDSVA